MGTATRVLLLEDDGEDQFLFAKMLVRGGLEPYEMRCVQQVGEIEALTRSFKPDVAVVDLHVPDSQGLATFQRAQRLLPEVPVVVLTGMDDREIGRRAIELGAQDYLVKGEFSPGSLDRTLRHAITRAAVQRASAEAVCFDEVTALPNRMLLRDRMSAAVRRAMRARCSFAVLFIDLDRFKPVNDTYGHHVGDVLLRAVGDRLRGSLRATDTVARWGGDEFVCVLESLHGADAAMQVAAQVHRGLLLPYEIEIGDGTVSLALGASIGVAVYPDHAREGEQLLSCADEGMYAAKHLGGGCVLWGSPGMQRLSRPPDSGVMPAAHERRGPLSEEPLTMPPPRVG